MVAIVAEALADPSRSRAIKFRTSSSRRTSARRNSTSVPSARSSAASSWPAVSWRPATTIRLPSRAKASAAAPNHEVDHLAMAVSSVASTRGVALLPAYAQNLLPRSVISRPLLGDVPTIDLVVGYSKTNTSPILKLFLSRIDDLIARVSKKTH